MPSSSAGLLPKEKAQRAGRDRPSRLGGGGPQKGQMQRDTQRRGGGSKTEETGAASGGIREVHVG